MLEFKKILGNNKKWSFRKIEEIEETLFNNTLEKFYNLGIEGLVRENIQNSLDGKLVNSNEPVKVIINTGEISNSEIPGIEEIKEHVKSLIGQNDYTRETIDHMRECINLKNVPYVSFEDRNTKGLKGAMHGSAIKDGDTWGVYAYKKGVHHVESDVNLEKLRGGSHGVGKIASNAASDLHLMFFANCDGLGNQHLGGTVELIEHEYKNCRYRATGYFTREENGIYKPFENNFNSVFEKNTRGLKIIVPYLRKQFQGEEKLFKAVCDNFFVAIIEGNLIVEINGKDISKDTILNIVKNKEIYPIQEYNEIKKEFTPIYVNTYITQEPIEINIKDKNKEYPFILRFVYNEEIKKGRVAIIRGIGMKIEDKKITGYANSSFNSVLIPKSLEGDAFLKSLENESHTSLSHEHIKNVELQKNAKRFINNIGEEIKKIIQEYIEKTTPTDGEIDTSELIYSIERNFKKNLTQNISTVEINKNGKRKTTKTKGKTRNTIDPPKSKDVNRKRRNKNGGKDKKNFLVNTESAKRLVTNKKELLAFDFRNVKHYNGEERCNIVFELIDGVGKIDNETFRIKSNYVKAFDKNQKKFCEINGNQIKNVSIKEGKASIELQTSENFNGTLKFIYYVEVDPSDIY